MSSMNYSGKLVKVDPEVFKVCGDTFLENGTFWEHQQVLDFLEKIKDSENVIDVGAQAGAFSMYAKWLPNSTFYSFEPCSENFRLLESNLDLNEIDNVLVSDCAISNYDGTSELNKSKSHGGLHTLGNPLRFADITKETVKVRKLDSFKFPTIHHIKIDTEGSELYVLQGADKLINRDHPRIFLEWNNINMKQCGYKASELYSYLESIGYIPLGERGENMEWVYCE